MGLRHTVAFRTRCAAGLGRIGLYRPRFGVVLESRKLQCLESVRAPSSVSVPRSGRPRRPCVRPKRPPSVRGGVRGPDGSQSGLWLWVLSVHETCVRLRKWGFAIDEETDLPQPDQTVNGANPIPVAGGRSDLMVLLPETVPQPAA